MRRQEQQSLAWEKKKKTTHRKQSKTKPEKQPNKKTPQMQTSIFLFLYLDSMLEGRELLTLLLGEILLSQPVRCKPPAAACPQ